MTDPAKLTIATPSAAWERAEKVRQVHRWLCEISRELRVHEDRYLPREPNEPDKAYEIRKQRSILHPHFLMALRQWNGRVVNDQLTWDVDPGMVELYDNIDRDGRSLRAFLDPVFEDLWSQGEPFVLVESTERAGGVPFWVLFDSSSVIRVRRGRAKDGSVVPKRIHLCNDRESGIWGTEIIESRRVLLGDGEPSQWPNGNPGPGAGLGVAGARYEFWDKTEKGEWMPSSDPELQPGKYPDEEIPGFLFRFGRVDKATKAVIPYSAWLAEVCRYKYASASDHDRLMRRLRNFVAYWAGAPDETIDQQTTIDRITPGDPYSSGYPAAPRHRAVRTIPMGAFTILTGDKDSTLQGVDMSGGNAELSFRDLEMTDAMIRVAELTPINPDKVQSTLGGQIINVHLADATLKNSAARLKDGVEELMKITAARMGKSNGGTLKIPTKFTLTRNEEAELARAISLCKEGLLSRKTLHETLQRNDPQFENMDIEQEDERIAHEVMMRDEQAARRVKAFADGPPMGEGE